VPDLTTSGYRLMGERLVATSHGPAAMFMYDDDRGSRIVVLTRPMSSADQNAPMTPQLQGDIGGFAWPTTASAIVWSVTQLPNP
jgi:anti-sigma factor RsiW